MKALIFSLIVSASITAAAQDNLQATTGVCGPANARFRVHTASPQQPPPAPPSGKAMLYFLQQSSAESSAPFSPVLVGLDGQWVGAYKETSWLAVPVEPGSHAICAYIKSNPIPEIAHFEAKAGSTYYFRTRVLGGPENQSLLLDALSAEQARYMLLLSAAAISTKE